jgi:hypothetical protein
MILAPNYKVTPSTFQPLVRLVDEGGQANAYALQPRDWFSAEDSRYRNFAYSAFASSKIGMPGSASFHRVRKSL